MRFEMAVLAAAASCGFAASPALAQASGFRTGAMWCYYEEIEGARRYFYTAITEIPVDPSLSEQQDYESRVRFTDSFVSHVQSKGVGPGNRGCQVIDKRPLADSKALAQSNFKQEMINKEKYRYNYILVNDWKMPVPVAPVASAAPKPTGPVSGKRDSLIVRDPEGPRPVAKAAPPKPVARPAQKVAAPKPAAKKATPCGGRGQRNCRAKPM